MGWPAEQDAIIAWLVAAFTYRAWAPLTQYAVGERRSNGGATYEATITGTSGSGGGPTGSGTAIPDDSVVWKHLAAGVAPAVIWTGNAPAPDGDYVSVGVSSSLPTGIAGETQTYDEDQPLGQEIEIKLEERQEVVLTVKAITAAVHGDNGAWLMLSRGRAAMQRSTPRNILAAACLGLLDVGAVVALPILTGAQFQGRAAMEVRLSRVETSSERTGYIATVSLVDLTQTES